MPEPVFCNNCGDRIGKLETAHLYREYVVCGDCWHRLTQPRAVLQYDPISHLQATPPKPEFVDHLFVPRTIALGLAVVSGLATATSPRPDHTLTMVFLVVWLALGVAKIIMKAAHNGQRG